MPLDKDALLQAIDAAKDNAYGSDSQSELGQTRARALDAYFGMNVNPSPEGRSQVVDRSVYETVHTLLPSLVRIFCGSSDEVCKLTPVGAEDEQAAELATALLNHIATQQNQWEQIVADWIHDAMLLANSYAIAYWDDSENIIREAYDGQSDDQVAALVSDTGITVVQHSQTVDKQATQEAQEAYQQAVQQFQQVLPQWQQAAMQAQAQGQPPPPPPQPPQEPQPVLLHDLVIERREHDGKVCIKVLPPEHCYISHDTPDWTLRDCPYFEFEQEKTIAELRAMGLEVPDDVNDDASDDREEDRARDRHNDNWSDDEGKGIMRRVWARMVWIRADVEGDGQSRMYYVIAVGRTILYIEPCGRIPVSSMTPQPLPHRHIGMSIAETVIDIQDQKTAVKRGGFDAMYLSINGRQIISDKVNLDDLLDSRPGGPVRLADGAMPGEGHVLPLVQPGNFDQIIPTLEYIDQERQNRTGASRYFSGTDANAINKTMGGTVALQNAASMRVEHIARTIAPAVENLFSAIQEVVSKHQNKALTIKLKGQWTTIDPQAWRTKRDVRISVGVGAGNKDSMMAQLGNVFGAQLQLLPMGLAGPQELHSTVTEMAKLSGFANPGKFWKDPTQSPPPPAQPPPEIQKEQMRIQADGQKHQAQAAQDAQKFQAEQALERERMQYQAQLDMQREEWQARQKQLEMQQAAELEQFRAGLASQQEQQRMAFEKWKAELDASVKLQIAGMKDKPDLSQQDGQIEQLVQAVRTLAEEFNAPTELVRDPSGRAVGVKRAGRVRQIQRGQDGRPIGVQ